MKKQSVKTFSIYAIENIKNHKIYIGSGTNIKNKRFCNHKWKLKKGKHNKKIQPDYDEFGLEAFKFEIIKNVDTKEELAELEQYWIENLQPEYNVQKTVKVKNMSDEQRENMIAKMSEKQRGANNPNCKYSVESVTKAKIMMKEDKDLKTISEAVGIPEAYLYLIKTEKRWKHVVV